ncbi:transcription repressor NadR [Aerococcaceae bacterium DSM 111021]|nr:transcription repressor NadR [Aerococcaceae bacterium DSM 111021]
MKAMDRRDAIVSILEQSTTPIKATDLATQFAVSRQVIVGDIALLRARNIDIIATNQGYILAATMKAAASGRYRGKIACLHTAEQAEEELRIIIDAGGTIEDVEVEHPVYGVLKASLRLNSDEDIQDFIYQMSQHEGEMLSSLTNGIHIHTITTPSKKEFDQIKAALNEAGILLNEN